MLQDTGGTGDFCGIQGSTNMSNLITRPGAGNLYQVDVFRSDEKFE
jgi:hypothetical protein